MLLWGLLGVVQHSVIRSRGLGNRQQGTRPGRL